MKGPYGNVLNCSEPPGGPLDCLAPHSAPTGQQLDTHTLYSCSGSLHNPNGWSECPNNPQVSDFPCCLGYHDTGRSKEAINTDQDASDTSYYVVTSGAFLDLGDGVSTQHQATHNILVRDSYFADIHDDAFESDALGSIQVEDSFIERAFIFMAARGAGTGNGETLISNRNMVELFRFKNAYEQKPGHGGFWKLNDPDPDEYKFELRGNYFLAGLRDANGNNNAMGDGQTMMPPVNRTTVCSGDNWLLWGGTPAQWNQMAEDSVECDDETCRTITGTPSPNAPDGSFDSNGERLAWFDNKSDCLTIFFKGDNPFGSYTFDCKINGSNDGTGNGCLSKNNNPDSTDCPTTGSPSEWSCISNASQTIHQFLNDTGWVSARNSWCSNHGGDAVCRPYQHLAE